MDGFRLTLSRSPPLPFKSAMEKSRARGEVSRFFQSLFKMETPHIVVLGGGFAGIEFCKFLKKYPVKITLIDRQNHHLFQPLLYQVASAGLAAPEIAHPIRSIFSRQKNVSVRMAEVTGINFDKKTVQLGEGESVGYDYLAIGLGVKTGYFGNQEWEASAPGLKSLNDATRIRHDVLLAYEKAESCTDQTTRDRLMTSVVIGGGPTGVELAGCVCRDRSSCFEK